MKTAVSKARDVLRHLLDTDSCGRWTDGWQVSFPIPVQYCELCARLSDILSVLNVSDYLRVLNVSDYLHDLNILSTVDFFSC